MDACTVKMTELTEITALLFILSGFLWLIYLVLYSNSIYMVGDSRISLGVGLITLGLVLQIIARLPGLIARPDN